MSFLSEILKNSFAIMRNLGEIQALAETLLISLLKNTKTYRNNLPQSDDHTELDGRIEKIQHVVNLVNQNASAFEIVKAAAGMADNQPPTLVVATRENYLTKTTYFLSLKESVNNLITDLEALGIRFSEEMKQAVNRKTSSALTQLEIHKQLFAQEDKPEETFDLGQVIHQTQNNPANSEPLTHLREKLDTTNTTYLAFEEDGRPISTERARYLLNEKNEKSLNQATVFDTISNTEYTSLPLDNVTQPKLTLKVFHTKEAVLNYYPMANRFALDKPVKKRLTRRKERLQKNQMIKIQELKQSVLQEMRIQLENLKKLEEVYKEKERKAALKNNQIHKLVCQFKEKGLRGFLSNFKTEDELNAFYKTINLSEKQKNSLSSDWQTTQHYFFIRVFYRNQSNETDLLKHLEKYSDQTKEAHGKVQYNLSEITKTKKETQKLLENCQDSIDNLIQALNQFTNKDKPFWWKRSTFDALIFHRNEMVTRLTEIRTSLKNQFQDKKTKNLPTLSTDKNLCIRSTLKDFKETHLKTGICLFRGNYRKNKRSLEATLNRVITAPAA